MEEEEEEEGLPDPVLRIGARCQREHRGGPGVVTAGPLGKGEPPFLPSRRTAQAPPRGGGSLVKHKDALQCDSFRAFSSWMTE